MCLGFLNRPPGGFSGSLRIKEPVGNMIAIQAKEGPLSSGPEDVFTSADLKVGPQAQPCCAPLAQD
jgi:hypothetical protein